MFFTTSPYLKRGRLADVVAAVQFMGAAGRPEAEIADWTERLSGNRENKEIERWTAVFTEHPEFFHVYTLAGTTELKAALRVRYANRLYDAETNHDYTLGERATLHKDIRDRLTSRPLDAEMIAAMATTAIGLHARASEDRTARRWWVPIFAAVLGFLGAVAGAFLGAK
jgi:hypothetical protein